MTNSQPHGLLGVQQPRVHLAPAGADELDAEQAIKFAAGYDLVLDPWQETVLRDWLRRRRDGKWSAATAGLSVPRQNGKNACLEVRELFGMIALGEKWLHTAHEVKTARKAFLRLASFFENERRWPELAELAKEIRRTNGQEAIVLHNGGSVEFVARSKSSGRGFTVDGIVLDECQELSDEAIEALLPTTSAAPQRNPQHIYTGTPPGPKASGDVFIRLRAAGHAGKDKRLSWLEWSMTPGGDLDDPAEWASANPGLGYRLGVEEIRGERTKFSDEGFARERGGLWDEVGSALTLSPAAWSNVTDSDVDVRQLRDVVLALDVAPNSVSASIVAVALDPARGFPVLELVERRAGSSWLVERVATLAQQYGARIALNSTGPIGALVPELIAASVNYADVRASDYTKACGRFAASVNERSLRHRGEVEFSAAVSGLKARKVGDGFTWSRASSAVDITPIVAATVGLWAVASADAPTYDVASSIY